MIVLGIETSCDETSASLVKDGCELLSVVTASSMDLHVAYGGVVPEIAARSHIESIIPVINEAVSVVGWDKIDAIAVTYGAGLGTSLLVGVMTARTLAIAKSKPLYAVNHVEGHVYANFISKTSLPGYKLPAKIPEFPILAVIVSGKHTQLVLFKDHFEYDVLGKTRDDAIGEAFDKVAKILGLPYPGGPSVSKAAENGDPHKFKLPKARLEEKYDFSFSGLKTAVLRLAQEQIGEDFTFPSFKLSSRLSEAQKCDIAASFQRIAVETIVDKTILAFKEFDPKCVIIAGGASANLELRRQLSEKLPIPIDYTDVKLSTDNGAMIATLGHYMAINNVPTADPYTLDIEPGLKM
ncbi:MAG: tRNA (adenosine(37)-N6)-threonylcarbamoyltransferase complex transferase subunit TsaD [Candidatus Saccharibacteria bacterium]|nr:tRNA (adenosine(37)-N6)-threonylcarbamoyltransferase complex transferase subunit TsaD [Candidatus Saccharibacteria bacterium]